MSQILCKVPWGGSPLSNPYFRAKPKLSVFENGKFSGHIFFNQKFSKKCKMLWREVLKGGLLWYRVRGEVREVILISRQNQNCPFLKTDSLADTFFRNKKVQKNVKCYEEKVLEIFLTLTKKMFFSGHFFWKKVE